MSPLSNYLLISLSLSLSRNQPRPQRATEGSGLPFCFPFGFRHIKPPKHLWCLLKLEDCWWHSTKHL